MRILLVTETFVPETDGIVTRLKNILPILKEWGHEILVVSPDLGETSYQGIPIEVTPSFTFPFYPSRPWGLPSNKVQDILLDFDPDIVHAVNPVSLAASGAHYANKHDYPLMTSYHTHIPKYLDYYKLDVFKPLIWGYLGHWHNMADLNITVSQGLMDELNDNQIITEGVLPRGIDLKKRNPKHYNPDLYQELTGGDPNVKVILYVGRLAAEKDLASLRPVLDQRPDLHLVLVGDGPEREELENVFAGSNTTFRGFLHGEKLSQAFATADAFVFPSTSETFGLVISEAMASGLPVIAAESQPTLEQIDNEKTGFVYEPLSTRSLLQALAVLDYPDHLEKISQAARSEAEKFSWENAAQALLDYYEQAITRYNIKRLKLAN